MIEAGGLAHIGFIHVPQAGLLRQIPPSVPLRLAGLLWLSKDNPIERNEKDVLNRLKMDHRTMQTVLRLVNAMDHPLPADFVSLKRSFDQIPPEEWENLLSLRAVLLNEDTARIKELLARSTGHPWNRGMLAVNGNDVAALGFKGINAGRVLNVLLDQVLENPDLNHRDALIRLVEEYKSGMMIEPDQNESPPDSVKK
jgi:hypothetical protein